MRPLKFALTSASVTALSLLFAGSAFASASASLKIEQLSSAKVGKVTVFTASGTTFTSNDKGVNPKNFSLALTEFGQVTVSVVPPPGASVKLTIYRSGVQILTTTTPQHSFSVYPNDTYRILTQYSFDRLGTIGITSDPSGVRFRMKGPNGKSYGNISPFTFKNIPVGQYTLEFAAAPGCAMPAPKGIVVEYEKRNTVHVSLPCDNATGIEVDRTRPSKRTLTETAKDREYKPRGQRK